MGNGGELDHLCRARRVIGAAAGPTTGSRIDAVLRLARRVSRPAAGAGALEGCLPRFRRGPRARVWGCLFKELRADLRRSMPRSQGSMPMRSRRWCRGGLTTRVHAAVDAPCPARFPVTPSHGAGSPQAKGLLCGLAGPCQAIADAGCGRDLPDAAGIPAPVHFWRSARHRSRAGRHPPGRSLRKKRRTVACFLKPDQTLPPHRAPLRGNRRLVKGIPRQRRRNRMVS
ncbi:hypothetical protein ATH84_1001235 [Paracoccus versutus]|uniref:Uncharacterized protein n=1 Tax=Paracoccus versutus TaxID=34007 RepID=A0AAQ0HME9_PARVE|nr:hypothetical protein ATH84_1001235 [Paracoccus versutus]